jgi:hypothetical protein
MKSPVSSRGAVVTRGRKAAFAVIQRSGNVPVTKITSPGIRIHSRRCFPANSERACQ